MSILDLPKTEASDSIITSEVGAVEPSMTMNVLAKTRWEFYPCYCFFFHSHQLQLIKEPNVSATMQQPSSVVHDNYKTYIKKTQKKHSQNLELNTCVFLGLF